MKYSSLPQNVMPHTDWMIFYWNDLAFVLDSVQEQDVAFPLKNLHSKNQIKRSLLVYETTNHNRSTNKIWTVCILRGRWSLKAKLHRKDVAKPTLTSRQAVICRTETCKNLQLMLYCNSLGACAGSWSSMEKTAELSAWQAGRWRRVLGRRGMVMGTNVVSGRSGQVRIWVYRSF